MWNRNEVPIACYFPKRGSGGLLFSGAQGLIVFEDPRSDVPMAMTPPLGPATQLNLEVILLDDRRCGAETKYR